MMEINYEQGPSPNEVDRWSRGSAQRPQTNESEYLNASEETENRPRQKKKRTAIAIIAVVVLSSFLALILHKYITDNKSGIHNGNNSSLSGLNDKDDKVKQNELEAARERAIQGKPADLREAVREYRVISEDIDRILREELEKKNIGGALTVAITNWQFNREQEVFKQPEELGFQRIQDEAALVNRALRGEVRIDKVEIKPASNRRFNVFISVTNLTPTPLECILPRGQVFELKDYIQQSAGYRHPNSILSSHYQGVSSSGGGQGGGGGIIIPPRDTETLNITAFCLNKGLAIPQGPGNISIYKIKDAAFDTTEALHAIMERANSLK